LLKSPELNEFVMAARSRLWKRTKVQEGAEQASGMEKMG